MQSGRRLEITDLPPRGAMTTQQSCRVLVLVVASGLMAIALAFSSSVQAQNIDKLAFKKGDVFLYKVKSRRGEAVRHESIADAGETVILATSGDKTENRQLDKSGNLLAVSNRVYQPKLEFYRFPLSPGQSWSQSATLQMGVRNFPVNLTARVIDWEEIAVPAGKFKALRVEYDVDFGVVGTVKTKAWLSSEISRPIKADVVGTSNLIDETETIELVSHNPAK